jgi:hypothetical protein
MKIDLSRYDYSKLTLAQRQGLKRDLEKLQLEELRESFAAPGGLKRFVVYFWRLVEPSRPLVDGWPLDAICDHLEAVTRGDIRRLLINVCPGFMKSLCANVFWPAFEWGPMGLPSHRFITASYSQDLTVRDNVRFRAIITSPEYQALYSNVFGPSKEQFNLVKVANDKTGWKLATSVGGVGTGERADRFVIDDGNSVKEAESVAVLKSTNQWFLEVVPTRLNDARTGAIINIQQRTSEADISGTILKKQLDYDHLCIRMEHESDYDKIPTRIGWTDPREEEGELAWPDRFPAHVVEELKDTMGPYASRGQFQQSPELRGGGILKREWWMPWNERKYPKCDGADGWIIASLDGAFTAKEKNDASGLTVWGCFTTAEGNRGVILVYAARLRKDLVGPDIPNEPGETYPEWKLRTHHTWGLVETVHDVCKHFRVKALYIENKGPGLSVIQTMERELRRSRYRYAVHPFEPGRLDRRDT